jgi:hypothetical protein
MAGNAHVTDSSFRTLDFGQLKEKSTRNAVVLAFLFGPVGLFYCTVIGGLVMTVLSILAMASGYFWTSSVVWVASVVWAWWETKD